MYWQPKKLLIDLVNKEENQRWGKNEIVNKEYELPKSYPEVKMNSISIRAFFNQILP